MPSELFYPYKFDESISQFRVSGLAYFYHLHFILKKKAVCHMQIV